MNSSTWRPERVMLGGLLAIYLLLAALYSWAIPPLEGFDAIAHYRAALYLRTTGQLPLLDRTSLAASYELITQPLLYHGMTALALAPLPVQDAWALTDSVANPYFEKGLSLRQSLTLPGVGWRAVVPMYIAAWISVLGGAPALIGTWRLGRALVPAHPTFAAAAASLVAFNPLFLFLAVTVTNDAWATGTMALCVAFAAEAAFAPLPDGSTRTRRWFWAGVWGGLATLTKYSGFLVGLPALVLWVVTWRRYGPRVAWRGLGVALFGALLVAWWWPARMLFLYGEPIPFGRMAEVITTLNRADPLPWSVVWEHVPWLIWSYWGVFVAVFAPAAFFSSVRVLMLGGVIGLLPALVRRDEQGFAHKGWTLAMALLWAAATAAAVLYWTRTVSYGEQGRLAHIGAPAFALLMVIGWQGFVPRLGQRWGHGALVAAMIGLALWQSHTAWDAYRLPAPVTLPQPDRPLDVRFVATGQVDTEPVGTGQVDTEQDLPAADTMQLVGADFPNGAVIAPGMPLPLTLYWTTPEVIPAQYTLFVHLADSKNRLLVQFDGVPAGGRHPTRQWRPGEVFADEHLLRLPADIAADIAADTGSAVTPGLASLSIGFYPIDDSGARLAVVDANGADVGDRLVLAQVDVRTAPVTPRPAPAAPDAAWQTGILLLDATLQQADGAQEDTGQEEAAQAGPAQEDAAPIGVDFTWWTRRTLQQDYTLFVQLLDADNNVLAQADVRGDRPTSVWYDGDVTEMSVPLTPAPDADPSTWQRVIVGWYDGGGTRIPLEGGGDFHVIATREGP